MIANVFWDIATSDTVMAFIAVIVAVALIVGYFPLLKWFPAISAYVQAARIVAAILLITLAFLGGFRVADGRAEVKSLQNRLASTERDLRLANDAAEKADEDRQAAADRAKEAQLRIEDYAERLKSRPNAACLLTPDDFVDRVSNDRKRK